MKTLRKDLFWDLNHKIPDLDKAASFVILRIIERGGLQEWHDMMQYYGKRKVKAVALQARYIPQRQLNFLSLYFKLPIEKFRCYTWQQSNPTHWNY
jgi:hypothetical protein